MYEIMLLGFITTATLMYFLPACIANYRTANGRHGIAALNLLLGWTFLGWVVALVWALAAAIDKDAIEAKRLQDIDVARRSKEYADRFFAGRIG